MKYLFRIVILSLLSCNGKSSPDLQHTADKEITDTTLKWVDYRTGELPPIGYYDAFDSIIKKWGIRYERIEGGCEPNSTEEKQYGKNNKRYFKALEKKYGKDWQERFHTEVEALDEQLHKY